VAKVSEKKIQKSTEIADVRCHRWANEIEIWETICRDGEKKSRRGRWDSME